MACPVCKKPENPEFKPFCSTRCQNVDLSRWFTGRYAVPTEEPPIDQSTEEEEK